MGKVRSNVIAEIENGEQVSGIEAVNQCKEFLEKKRPDLVISRVPPKTKEEFKNLAIAECCNDYGWTLKECVNAYFELQYLKKMIRDENYALVKGSLDSVAEKKGV